MLSAFTSWLSAAVHIWLTWLANVGIDLLQVLFNGFFGLASTIVGLFPSGPTITGPGSPDTNSVWSVMVTTLNWVFPVTTFLNLLAFIVAGYLAYFLIAPVARWLKLIT